MTTKKNVYLGLGTNFGNRRENLTRAMDELSLALGNPIAISGITETTPWGFQSDNNFLNCVAGFSTGIPPAELLDITEYIERKLGRTTKSTNGTYHDRIIDIDILLYGDEIINNDRLTIPHPLMHKRMFVLEPLAEIAAHTVHPIFKENIKQLLRQLKEPQT